MARLFCFAALAAGVAAGESREVLAFVKEKCAACHNPRVKSGDVDLASLQSGKTFDEDRVVWEKAVEKLKTGQMPPPGTPKPPAAEVAGIVRSLESEFARQDRLAKPDPGRVSARRLNRAEYNNTIRDLLAIDLRPADDFPADTPAFGFDNIADALNISPALLENYIDAAERSVRSALFGPARIKPSAVHYPSPVRLNDSRGTKRMPKNPADYDESGLSTLHSMHVLHRFPVDAEYSFRIVLNGHRPNQSEPAHPALWIDGKLSKEFEVDATDLEGQIVETTTRVTAGEHLVSASYLRNFHGLPPSYGGPAPSKRPEVALINPRGKLTEKDIETLRKFGTRIKTDGVETRIDNRFESLDIGGPFNQTMGPAAESLRRVFVCGHPSGKHQPACTRTILANFASRAFRRPVTAKEIDQLTGIATLARKNGDPFEESISTALQAVLVSPHFLFRIERDRPAQNGRLSVPVSELELASRLSFFLWSSMPDDELRDIAARDRLRKPGVLDAQVRRMLRDPKSQALVEEFFGQWLQFKNMDVVRPDSQKFPHFDDGLRQSMRRETAAFIADLVRQDRSILDLLDSNRTFLDERLARFYGIEGVTGPEFRAVDMTANLRGGGILAHASILTISSYSTRTSPVLRGKWILENLLNAPPPAPPASVPPLDETKVGESATLRQQMEAHRRNPACASCHSRMDPLGFGLENFNAIGEWRTHEGSLPVDASGTLPDGRSFGKPSEFKALLQQDREAFARGFTEKLLIYSLGRGLERYDRPAQAVIVRSLEANRHAFSGLVSAIVHSLPFQQRRAREVRLAAE
jgi:hypothetical protein